MPDNHLDPCEDCRDEVTGGHIHLLYEGEQLVFHVYMCGCGITIELVRQMVDGDRIPCPFCDHVGPEGLPFLTHTHETVETIW